MSEDSPSNRRRRARFRAGLPAVVRFKRRIYDAIAYDLSEGGVLLCGEMPMPGIPEIEVTIRSNAGDLRLSTVGRVAHVFRDDEYDELHLGLEFSGLDEAQRRTLDSLVHRVVEGMAPAAIENLPAGASPEQVRKALGSVALPHRIMYARRATPREREFLLQDGKPPVLDALARNPGITLPEIRQILRSARLRPATVEFIAADPRWKRDADLKMQLATHPRASLALAEKLAFELDKLGMKKLIQLPGLPDAIKAKIRAKLSDRELGGW